MKFEFYNNKEKITETEKKIVMAILTEAFPKHERRDELRQIALFGNPFYNIMIVKEVDDILGFILYWDFGNFLFYEHFAVNPERRNCGIGEIALKKLIETSEGRPIFLEVEKPNDEISTRRMNFYIRNGFENNDFFYNQMPLNKGDIPTQMIVMSKNIKINSSSFEKYKKVIYKNVYECCVE